MGTYIVAPPPLLKVLAAYFDASLARAAAAAGTQPALAAELATPLANGIAGHPAPVAAGAPNTSQDASQSPSGFPVAGAFVDFSEKASSPLWTAMSVSDFEPNLDEDFVAAM